MSDVFLFLCRAHQSTAALSASKKCHKYKRRLLCLLIDFLSLSWFTPCLSQSHNLTMGPCANSEVWMSHFCKNMQIFHNESSFWKNLQWVTQRNVKHLVDSCRVIAHHNLDKWLWKKDFDDTLSNFVVSTSRPQRACCCRLETWNKLSRRFERSELLQWMIARWEMCGQSGWKSHGTIIDDEGVHCALVFSLWYQVCLLVLVTPVERAEDM